MVYNIFITFWIFVHIFIIFLMNFLYFTDIIMYFSMWGKRFCQPPCHNFFIYQIFMTFVVIVFCLVHIEECIFSILFFLYLKLNYHDMYASLISVHVYPLCSLLVTSDCVHTSETLSSSLTSLYWLSNILLQRLFPVSGFWLLSHSWNPIQFPRVIVLIK